MSMMIEAAVIPKESGLSEDLIDKIITLDSLHAPRYFRWKGVVDRAAAALLLIPALPLIGVLVVLIRRTSPGPGIFRQRRVGQCGRVYTMFKLRSMRIDAEAGTGPVWCIGADRDPRLTRIGYWLRRLHLDELPQLFNVFKGEMSLVGPRPERPEFVEVLADAVPGYMNRLAAPPGITGLAQINLPADEDLDDVRRKLVLDLEYVRTANLLFDVRLVGCTTLRIFGMKGRTARRLLRLDRQVTLATPNEPTQSTLPPTPERVALQQTAQSATKSDGRRLALASQCTCEKGGQLMEEADNVLDDFSAEPVGSSVRRRPK